MINGVRVFVDEDRIDLVDDRVMMAALSSSGRARISYCRGDSRSQLIVGAIGDIGGIGAAAFVVVEAMHDDPGRDAEETIDAAHPFGVAAGEIIVDGDDMHALAGEGVEIGASVATRVLPPAVAAAVRTPAIAPSCRTIPPTS